MAYTFCKENEKIPYRVTGYLLVVLSAACDGNDNATDNSTGYTLTREDIINNQSKIRGTIYKQVGADGPYKENGTIIGNYGDAGSVNISSGAARISESWPATPNYSRGNWL